MNQSRGRSLNRFLHPFCCSDIVATIAAIKGLGTSSQASTSQEGSISHASSSRAFWLSSSTRVNVHFSGRAVRHASRKCRVHFAALIDPQVKSKISSLKLEKYGPEIVGTLLLERLIDSTDFQTELDQRAAEPVLELTDTDFKSNLEHRLWVAFGATAVTGLVAKALTACHCGNDEVQITAGMLAAWVLSDLGTGFYHWGVDNYGRRRSERRMNGHEPAFPRAGSHEEIAAPASHRRLARQQRHYGSQNAWHASQATIRRELLHRKRALESVAKSSRGFQAKGGAYLRQVEHGAQVLERDFE